MTGLSHEKIVIMATHGFEQSELMVPLNELEKAGAQVDVATLDGNLVKGWIEQDWLEFQNEVQHPRLDMISGRLEKPEECCSGNISSFEL